MNAAQLAILAAELKTAEYASYLPDSPGIVADKINAYTESMLKSISAESALLWAAPKAWASIFDASRNAAHPCRSSCLALRDAVLAGMRIDVQLDSMQEMFSGWVAGGVIDDDTHAQLISIATQPASRAEVLGLPNVMEQDVRAAWQS